MTAIFDVVVVGSGPSGAHAAAACAERGKRVQILDVGIDDPATRESIPAGSFRSLRHGDEQQARYFVGDDIAPEQLSGVRVGAQLTPPRRFITAESERLAPIASQTFGAMQSLALGGLGAGWGAGTYSYNSAELRAVGLPEIDMQRCYDAVAAAIGISAAAEDDTAAELSRYRPTQAPLELDTNAASLFRTYHAKRPAIQSRGLRVGRAPAAILSEPLERAGIVRNPNPYEDMDFYSDASRSVYRPRYTIEELGAYANVSYRDSVVVRRFVCDESGVDIHVTHAITGQPSVVRARRLLLAAGALGTSRIVLRSLGLMNRDFPILSNAYTYLPCVNLAMFGRPAQDRRHSLAQLCGVFAEDLGSLDASILSFFSYRSLLLFKLVKEMPMHPALGLATARLLLTSLTIVGVHHPERRTPMKTMRLTGIGDAERLEIAYSTPDDERAWLARRTSKIRSALRALGCIALGTIAPGNGSSIHYAGALTITADRNDAAGTADSGALHRAPAVYVADSANWRYLPAKGLTMSLMANARRVAAVACASLADAT
jgi:hypothetical protein